LWARPKIDAFFQDLFYRRSVFAAPQRIQIEAWQSRIKIGVVWGLHVITTVPDRNGLAERLLDRVVSRFRELHCTRGLVHAVSKADAAALCALGFASHNAMVLELDARPESPLSPTALLPKALATSGARLPPALPQATPEALATPAPNALVLSASDAPVVAATTAPVSPAAR